MLWALFGYSVVYFSWFEVLLIGVEKGDGVNHAAQTLGGTPCVLDITTPHTKQLNHAVTSIIDILSIIMYYLIGLFNDL